MSGTVRQQMRALFRIISALCGVLFASALIIMSLPLDSRTLEAVVVIIALLSGMSLVLNCARVYEIRILRVANPIILGSSTIFCIFFTCVDLHPIDSSMLLPAAITLVFALNFYKGLRLFRFSSGRPLQKRTIIVLVIALGAIGIVSIMCLWSSGQPKRETAELMPKGYDDLYFGMYKREFERLRPDAVWNDSESGYHENVDNTFFKYVSFGFEGEELADVAFYGGDDRRDVEMHLDGFLMGCIKKWGAGYEKRLWMSRASPTLFWQKKGANIVVLYLPKTLNAELSEEDRAGRTGFVVRIYDPAVALWAEVVADGTRSCTEQEIETYFQDIPSSVQPRDRIFE